MNIFNSFRNAATSATKARVLCAITGLVCALLISTLIVPNPLSSEAKTVPSLIFWEMQTNDCGVGCYVVACDGLCNWQAWFQGYECCDSGVSTTYVCLYCGP